MRKHQLPSMANLNLDIDLNKLQGEMIRLAEKFVDVRTANPMLCDNHMELVASVSVADLNSSRSIFKLKLCIDGNSCFLI